MTCATCNSSFTDGPARDLCGRCATAIIEYQNAKFGMRADRVSRGPRPATVNHGRGLPLTSFLSLRRGWRWASALVSRVMGGV